MLITATDAAKLLAVKPPRLYQLVRENVVPYVRLGERQIRFNEDALKEWIKHGGIAQSNGSSAHDEKVAA